MRMMLCRAHQGVNEKCLGCSRELWSLSEGLREEGEHAVAGDVGAGGEFEGEVAAGEFDGAGVGTVAAEGVQHLACRIWEDDAAAFALDHERAPTRAPSALSVTHA